MATIDLGKIKLVWRGTYNNSTAYTVDDVVEFTDGGVTSTYICVANSTGNNPSSGGTAHASWNYMAKGVVDPIPTQSGNSGKFLKTDGSALSFAAAGGLVQAKQWIKQSTLLNDSNNASVMGSPFDGTARLTPASAANFIKVTYFTTADHSQTWRSGYHRLQYSPDGGSSYYGIAGGSCQSYIEGDHGTGNMITIICMFHPNTTNEVRVRVINNSHNSGQAKRWGQYNNENGQDGSSISPPTDAGVIAVGHAILLEEIESSIGSITTIA